MRKIETFNNTATQTRVYWCVEWQEYQVKFYRVAGGAFKIDSDSTYHTDNKQDAIDTARKMNATYR